MYLAVFIALARRRASGARTRLAALTQSTCSAVWEIGVRVRTGCADAALAFVGRIGRAVGDGLAADGAWRARGVAPGILSTMGVVYARRNGVTAGVRYHNVTAGVRGTRYPAAARRDERGNEHGATRFHACNVASVGAAIDGRDRFEPRGFRARVNRDRHWKS